MSKDSVLFTEVRQRNGVTRRVPTSYYKPLGKTKTVSMTLPISIVEVINEIAANSEMTKSKVMSELLAEAIEGRTSAS